MDVSLQDFRDVQRLVRSLCGLVLSDDKTYLVSTRLEPIVRAHGCDSFSEYLGRLQHFSANEIRDELVEALTTGETSFNRDTYPFEDFRLRVLPELANQISNSDQAKGMIAPVRIWSAGCSTGQEPYSIAMAIHDFLQSDRRRDFLAGRFSILATDVSNKSLSVAEAARYHSRELERGIATHLRQRYFDQDGDYWTIKNELRKLIEFRRLNFIDELSNLGQFEIIFCRNVLIYFDVPTRQRLSDQFYRMLTVGGRLILGSAESLYGLKTEFQSEQVGRTYLYRKVS